MTNKITVQTAAELIELGEKLGALLGGGEVIELAGDIGAGKTTFTKGVARGMKITDDVQSPTFTISRNYDAPGGLRLAHYDFYRLRDAGIMKMELDEAMHDPGIVTVIEWSDIVSDVLPADALRIAIAVQPDDSRLVTFEGDGKTRRLIKELA